MSKIHDFSYVTDGNKRAVLLLHGLTGHPFEMKFFGKSLSQNGFDIFCPVLPGHCSGVGEIKRHDWKDWLDFSLQEYDLLKGKYDEVYVAGLCLGAVLAVAIAEERDNVSGICALSTTLYLDGWEMPWYKAFMGLGLNTLLKFFYAFPEAGSFGIKNKRLSEKVANTAQDNSSVLNCFPLISIDELLKLNKYTMKNSKKVNTPALIIHSVEDNLTSVKSSEFVYKNISSEIKEFIKIDDCYHVVTLDNKKDEVSKAAIEFFNKISKVEMSEHKELAASGVPNE